MIDKKYYKAGMIAKTMKDPACYGLMHVLGFGCRVRCSWRSFCKTKSKINKRNEG